MNEITNNGPIPAARKEIHIKQEIMSKNICLMKPRSEHINYLFDMLNTPGVRENLVMNVKTAESFRNWFKYFHAQWEHHNEFTYTITNNEQNLPIGQISLHHISFKHYRTEIGIWLGSPHWNKGFGSEALKLILNYCFKDLYLNRIEAHIFLKNQASIALFERFGFKKEGIKRGYIKKDDIYKDVYLYSLLARDFVLNK